MTPPYTWVYDCPFSRPGDPCAVSIIYNTPHGSLVVSAGIAVPIIGDPMHDEAVLANDLLVAGLNAGVRCECRSVDWNNDGAVNSQDFFDFLAEFYAAQP